MTGFTSAEVLKNHQKYCNGVDGGPTRIEMPEESKNKIASKTSTTNENALSNIRRF